MPYILYIYIFFIHISNIFAKKKILFSIEYYLQKSTISYIVVNMGELY